MKTKYGSFATYTVNVKPEKRIWARQMRKNPTFAEDKLWQRVRARRLGYKILRQHPILGFIVDFYCSKKHLAIEVDGEIHKRQKEYDEHRDKAISSLGIKILRFTNEQVLHDLGFVISEINKYLKI